MSLNLPLLNRRAVSLLSGGLDSLLAAKLLSDLGVEVKAVTFATDFGCGTGTGGGCGTDTRGLKLGFDIKFCHLGDAYNRMVQSPRFGYGKNMNPCIDCRIMMLAAGWEYAQACGASWLITGEVLQQRPMSQRKSVMAQVERELGLERRILRPLSAKLLPVTEMEQQGIVDRDGLYDISGRSRKRQMALAKELGITSYPTPAGGCLLTDPQHARKVRDLFRFMPAEQTVPSVDVRLLQFGRNFRISDRLKCVVGRNQDENEMLADYARPSDWLLVPQKVLGPNVLATGEASLDDLTLVARLAAVYGKGEAGDGVVYAVTGPGPTTQLTVDKPPDRQWVQQHRI